MTQIIGDLLFQLGDLGSGWEAGPTTIPKAVWGITTAHVMVVRTLYCAGKDKGTISALQFENSPESQEAMTTLKPFVTSPLPSKMPGGTASTLALLGDEAFGGEAVFRIPNMEAIGMAPTSHRTVLFRDGRIVVFIRCQDLTEHEAYDIARKIAGRLKSLAAPAHE